MPRAVEQERMRVKETAAGQSGGSGGQQHDLSGFAGRARRWCRIDERWRCRPDCSPDARARAAAGDATQWRGHEAGRPIHAGASPGHWCRPPPAHRRPEAARRNGAAVRRRIAAVRAEATRSPRRRLVDFHCSAITRNALSSGIGTCASSAWTSRIRPKNASRDFGSKNSCMNSLINNVKFPITDFKSQKILATDDPDRSRERPRPPRRRPSAGSACDTCDARSPCTRRRRPSLRRAAISSKPAPA